MTQLHTRYLGCCRFLAACAWQSGRLQPQWPRSCAGGSTNRPHAAGAPHRGRLGRSTWQRTLVNAALAGSTAAVAGAASAIRGTRTPTGVHRPRPGSAAPHKSHRHTRAQEGRGGGHRPVHLRPTPHTGPCTSAEGLSAVTQSREERSQKRKMVRGTEGSADGAQHKAGTRKREETQHRWALPAAGHHHHVKRRSKNEKAPASRTPVGRARQQPHGGGVPRAPTSQGSTADATCRAPHTATRGAPQPAPSVQQAHRRGAREGESSEKRQEPPRANGTRAARTGWRSGAAGAAQSAESEQRRCVRAGGDATSHRGTTATATRQCRRQRRVPQRGRHAGCGRRREAGEAATGMQPSRRQAAVTSTRTGSTHTHVLKRCAIKNSPPQRPRPPAGHKGPPLSSFALPLPHRRHGVAEGRSRGRGSTQPQRAAAHAHTRESSNEAAERGARATRAHDAPGRRYRRHERETKRTARRRRA